MLPQVSGEFGIVFEPELRFSEKGTAWLKLRGKATSRKQVNGEWTDGDVCFIDILCFQKLAENSCESISKGDTIVVTGNLQMREYEKDGEKVKAYQISATSIGMALKYAPINRSSSKPPQLAAVKEQAQSEEPPF